MWYGFLADLIVAFHLAYVSFVVVGQLVIVVGVALKWGWVRNFWFRLAHLVAILIVGLEAVGDVVCPLTAWEAELRQLAGQEFSGESFIARLMHAVLFYNAPEWALNLGHIGFALLVLITFFLAPPRWPKLRRIGRASLPRS